MDGVRGFDEVMANLNRQINGIKNRSMAGLLEASFKIIEASNRKVPRDTTNLVSSSYVRPAQNGDLSVEIGYSAGYAINVHEAPMTLKGQPRAHFGKTREGVEFGGGTGKGNYWDPAGESKFLENTVRLNEKDIVRIVLENARVE